MSTMTWEKIRDHHLGKVAYYTDENYPRAIQRHQAMADFITDHLAQPAQAVDVGAIRDVIEQMRKASAHRAMPPHYEAGCYMAWIDDLTRAISGEKAGPVDGWQFRWHTEGDDSLLLIAHPDHGGVGVHKDPTDARTIPEAMLYLLARDLLPTSPAPDKEDCDGTE